MFLAQAVELFMQIKMFLNWKRDVKKSQQELKQ